MLIPVRSILYSTNFGMYGEGVLKKTTLIVKILQNRKVGPLCDLSIFHVCKPAHSALISDVCKNHSKSRGSKLTLIVSQPGLDQRKIVSTSCGTYMTMNCAFGLSSIASNEVNRLDWNPSQDDCQDHRTGRTCRRSWVRRRISAQTAAG